jgi:hypothetical protein
VPQKFTFLLTLFGLDLIPWPIDAKSYFFFGKLTYVLKEEDTNIIRGIPQIYNDNRNIKQQMATC